MLINEFFVHEQKHVNMFRLNSASSDGKQFISLTE